MDSCTNLVSMGGVMRTLPQSIKDAFKEQQGVSIHFVVAINWMNVEEIWYSDCEFENIYAYVRQFSGYESVIHVEGLGSVSSIKISFPRRTMLGGCK